MKEITAIIQKKVVQWNSTCSSMNSSLFLADSFEPKPIPNTASDEVVFWYDVTNLYSLFCDCMPYFTKAGVYFNRSQIKLNSTENLLALILKNNYLNCKETLEIEKFIKAIKETRSCFCHNKHKSTFNVRLLSNSFGYHSQSWEFFSHLGCNSDFNYTEAINLFYQKTNSFITIIDKAINAVKAYGTNLLIDEWSKSIAAWYLSSNDIIYRGLLLYRNIGRIHSVADGFDKMNNQEMGKLARKNGLTIEKFVQNLHDELTEEVIYSPVTASPENVLYKFFDRII